MQHLEQNQAPSMRPSHHLFAIKDTLTGIFERPFLERTAKSAMRAVAAVVEDPKSMLHKYPDHYQLWRVGSWFEENGFIDPAEPLQLLCEVQVLKTPEKKDVPDEDQQA